MSTRVEIPRLALVVLIGVSGSGKSTFAADHFAPFETISSDFCRGLVSGDENDQASSADAFDVLAYIAGKRLAAGRLTVVDATNVTRETRRQFVQLARDHDVLPVAVVLDTPVGTAIERNASRQSRDFGARVVKRQHDQLRRSLKGLGKEGFRTVHVLTPEQAADAEIIRTRLLNDRRDDHGPFDVIGDVHGCRSELESLLDKLGYRIIRDVQGRAVDAEHPDGRRALFLGDLVDRGPDTPGVLRLAMGMTAAGHAVAITGNHEHKLVRALAPRRGRSGKQQPNTAHGLQQTLDQLAAEPAEFVDRVTTWCRDLIAHLVLDDGKLVVAHAGLKESYHGRASGRVRSFALYGDTTGEIDEFGLPVRLPWAEDYRGSATVLYGHTPVPDAVWLNNTLCLDTGCVFGGRLTALRYPENEIVDVPAEQVWCEPAKPFGSVQRTGDDLQLGDVLGRRVIETVQHGRITIGEDQAAGAFEVMTRFALHPRWLGYLPPTMAPAAATDRDDHLEFPDTAFAEYADAGVRSVICEEKHMGSRAVIMVCADEAAARRRFGDQDERGGGRTGVVHTRTGRAFAGPAQTEELLGRLRAAIGAAGLWQQLGADWLLLDAEILPWSLKADALIREQYAATGAAGRMMLPAVRDRLRAAADRGLDLGGLDSRIDRRLAAIDDFSAAYRPYQWPTDGWGGVQVAPFQLLASGSTDGAATYETRDHGWHLELADRLHAVDAELVRSTRRLSVRTDDPDSVAAGIDWWTELTATGGEGMVVKPFPNLTRGSKGLVQPGLKVRGRQYLRLIYGPDYLEPVELARLKKRNLGHKRSLALREYALGLESLRRLTTDEPLWRVHETVFAVLALESDPVDPRL
ncbi:polynucleotide kinase-phosphatase [Microlunatus soli]|uniref:Polynucleotide kinase-phosphatase n=1 Tax=Microlunatus soli TaxID=630515 RepID=A0A1H1X7A6_9ACTN|nr:polynucleotide kinase-phosphatase [Microlunatus soli]SDT04980.1 polynucleotide kinase-phosphatase [Microlunatus soli]